MKLRQIEFVVGVVQNGFKVTAAAEQLFTSQPGVSTQIRRLEAELGVTLFVRSGKQFSGLTPEGAALLPYFEY